MLSIMEIENIFHFLIFLNLAGIFFKLLLHKKESSLQDSPPTAGRLERHLPFRRSAILPGRAFLCNRGFQRNFLLQKKSRLPTVIFLHFSAVLTFYDFVAILPAAFSELL